MNTLLCRKSIYSYDTRISAIRNLIGSFGFKTVGKTVTLVWTFY